MRSFIRPMLQTAAHPFANRSCVESRFPTLLNSLGRGPRVPMRLFSLALLLGLSLLPTSAALADLAPARQAIPVASQAPSHAPFDALLQAVVNRQGRVNYPLLKTRLPELNTYLQSLAALTSEGVQKLNQDEKLALYLNAYNARVLQELATAWPVKSIMDIPGVFKTRTFVLAGRSLTLDQLENEIIRPQFREPRVHFALNCGAVSCPPLQNRAFTGATVRNQLEQARDQFMRTPEAFQVEVASKTVTASKIFEWFGGDFVAISRTTQPRPPFTLEQTAVLNYLHLYTTLSDMRTVLEGTPRLVFREYNWGVNAQ